MDRFPGAEGHSSWAAQGPTESIEKPDFHPDGQPIGFDDPEIASRFCVAVDVDEDAAVAQTLVWADPRNVLTVGSFRTVIGGSRGRTKRRGSLPRYEPQGACDAAEAKEASDHIVDGYCLAGLEFESLEHRRKSNGALKSKFRVDMNRKAAVIEDPQIAPPLGPGLAGLGGHNRNQ